MKVAFFCLIPAAAAVLQPLVNTSLGPVIGVAGTGKDRCSSFYGVPYAAPPVGPLRFRPPQAMTPWIDPRPAVKVGASCLQTFGDSFVNLPLPLEKVLERLHILMEPMSEDCLFLNIWTPHRWSTNTATNTKNNERHDLLPVMVWFHGGSYMGGSGDLQSGVPFYDGQILCATATSTPVVVVSVNYRLGVFGFFADRELLDESDTAGNMGIQDQRLALEWVRDNAQAFGGDAARVTIFGESAGAGSVATHLLSPRSAPLFAASIIRDDN